MIDLGAERHAAGGQTGEPTPAFAIVDAVTGETCWYRWLPPKDGWCQGVELVAAAPGDAASTPPAPGKEFQAREEFQEPERPVRGAA